VHLRLVATVFNTPDPNAIAAFYERLLELPRLMNEPDWVVLRNDANSHALSFQRDATHERPAWPNEPGRQRAAVHLDLVVDDLDAATAHAEQCGALLAGVQHNVNARERVMIDPDGNPFCLIERTVAPSPAE